MPDRESQNHTALLVTLSLFFAIPFITNGGIAISKNSSKTSESPKVANALDPEYYPRYEQEKLAQSEQTSAVLGAESSFLGNVGLSSDLDRGNVVAKEGKWVWKNSEREFVPQLVMFAGPHHYYDSDTGEVLSEKLVNDIDRLMVDQGFNGIHIPVNCRWFHIQNPVCDEEANQIDPATFNVLKEMITKTYERGGMVHIWVWGDRDKGETPYTLPYQFALLDGTPYKALADNIAAELGPLDGWTLGFGYDFYKWNSDIYGNLDAWYLYLSERFAEVSNTHLQGGEGRSDGFNFYNAKQYNDYFGYYSLKPSYKAYSENGDYILGYNSFYTHKPSLTENRYRVYSESANIQYNYSEDDVRRGLYRSTIAGGVGNIWGNLDSALNPENNLYADLAATGEAPSNEFSEIAKIWFLTYRRFFFDRFSNNLQPMCASIDTSLSTTGHCLANFSEDKYVFYIEDSSLMLLGESLDTNIPSGLPVVVVDTKEPYKEIDFDYTTGEKQLLEFKKESDWVVAVGNFGVKVDEQYAGDIDNDGDVDGLDFALLTKNFEKYGMTIFNRLLIEYQSANSTQLAL